MSSHLGRQNGQTCRKKGNDFMQNDMNGELHRVEDVERQLLSFVCQDNDRVSRTGHSDGKGQIKSV